MSTSSSDSASCWSLSIGTKTSRLGISHHAVKRTNSSPASVSPSFSILHPPHASSISTFPARIFLFFLDHVVKLLPSSSLHKVSRDHQYRCGVGYTSLSLVKINMKH